MIDFMWYPKQEEPKGHLCSDVAFLLLLNFKSSIKVASGISRMRIYLALISIQIDFRD